MWISVAAGGIAEACRVPAGGERHCYGSEKGFVSMLSIGKDDNSGHPPAMRRSAVLRMKWNDSLHILSLSGCNTNEWLLYRC